VQKKNSDDKDDEESYGEEEQGITNMPSFNFFTGYYLPGQHFRKILA